MESATNYSYINKEDNYAHGDKTPFFKVYSDNWPYRSPDPNAGNESYTATGDINLNSLMDTLDKRNEARRLTKVEPVEKEKMDEQKSKFWFHNPSILIQDWDQLLPDHEESNYSKYLNSFVRLSIIAFLVMWFFNKDSKYIWLPIITMILTIYLYTFKIRTMDQLKGSINENFGSNVVESIPKNIDPLINKVTESESINNKYNYSLLTDVDKNYTTFTPKLSDKPGDYTFTNAFDQQYFKRTKYSPENQNFNFELYGDVSSKFSRFNAERNKEKLVPFEKSLDNWPAMLFGNKTIDRKLYYNDR